MKKKIYLSVSTAQLLVALMMITNCGAVPDKNQKATNMSTAPITRNASGLRYQELKAAPANAQQAVAGRHVFVHYTGYLNDGNDGLGTKFDSSIDRGAPFGFDLGAGQVIKGWDEGVAGMKVGGKRRLLIPASLGYGSRGAGRVIPPNSDLIFDVELLEVR